MTVRTEQQGRVLVLTIHNPPARNAVSPAVWSDIAGGLALARRETSIGAVVITGSGERIFSAGADIQFMKQRTVPDVLAGQGQELYAQIETFPKPVIAAVNGYALGGGCELALACDIRLAGESARFGLPEVGLGIIPGAGGTQRLVKILGLGRAKHLLLTGEIIDAQEAYRVGLVSRVVPLAELLPAALALAEQLMSKGPVALALVKAAALAATDAGVWSGMMLERFAQAAAFGTADQSEGLSAFLEKRQPDFKGR